MSASALILYGMQSPEATPLQLWWLRQRLRQKKVTGPASVTPGDSNRRHHKANKLSSKHKAKSADKGKVAVAKTVQTWPEPST